jgi:hypothetical protein
MSNDLVNIKRHTKGLITALEKVKIASDDSIFGDKAELLKLQCEMNGKFDKVLNK